MSVPVGRYTVEFLEAAKSQLRAISRHAIANRRGQAVASALRNLIDRLQSDPQTAGEPLYDLRSLRLHVRRVALDPLYVEYGVHFDRPFVIVRYVAGLGDDGV